jgi:pSer/pThr/pTyr-binding forkhead associated (FHA) protein
MARLVLLSEGLTGRTFELKSEKTTVGRVSDNMFEIPEASVSSHHAELHLRGNELLIKDLNSTNGTFINGEKVSEAVLKPGQILRLGMVEMRLETADPTAAAAASKKVQTLEQTRVIPQGVKLDELEGTRTPLDFGKSGFEKKNNKATKYFVTAVVVIGAILVGALVWVLMTAHH